MAEQRNASQKQLKELLESGFLDQNKYEELVNTMEQSKAPSSSAWHLIDRIIVCFFADGSDKYTEMTTMAIASFLDKTPNIKVGLLTHDSETHSRVLSNIDPRHHARIVWRQTSEVPHLLNWNPTQYKLDIAKFVADGFENIFWMDSDTLTYEDMTHFLLRFAESNKQFFFVKDHVMQNSDFVANWTKERALTLIPQACFMGFKYNIIEPFFSLWRNIWEKWISPLPFTNFADPNPNFIGSMFCIEQYALAMALAHFLDENFLGDDGLMLFERELILLQHNHVGRLPFEVLTQLPTSISGVSSISGLNLSGLRLSGVNLSGLGFPLNMSALNISGLNVSGLNLSAFNISALNVSGLNVSGVNISGLNLSGLGSSSSLQYLIALASNTSGINVSGLSVSGSGLNLSGISVEQLLSNLNVSGVNLSGINLSALTLSEFERLLARGSIDLSAIDYKYLQSGPIVPTNLAIVDKFGNSFIHYYNQNFEPVKEGARQTDLFNAQQKF